MVKGLLHEISIVVIVVIVEHTLATTLTPPSPLQIVNVAKYITLGKIIKSTRLVLPAILDM